ncbi:MAG TPA: ThuA domain-containing protein [Armatimonadota bacterium]|jgi:hypothetical protein
MSKKLLYCTHSAGFRHDCLSYSLDVMEKLGRESNGAFEASVTNDATLITPDAIERCDAIAFCTTGELPMTEAAKSALIEGVKGGKGFIGIHNATDTFYQFAPYGEMLGGYFDGHPWNQEVGIIVEDKNHPATRDLGDSFRITDEIYQQRNFSREKSHVLLRLDNSTVDLKKESVKRADLDFAMAWCRTYGEGRVFYTGLGHSNEVWGDERFQRHLLGGILWALRLAD